LEGSGLCAWFPFFADTLSLYPPLSFPPSPPLSFSFSLFLPLPFSPCLPLFPSLSLPLPLSLSLSQRFQVTSIEAGAVTLDCVERPWCTHTHTHTHTRTSTARNAHTHITSTASKTNTNTRAERTHTSRRLRRTHTHTHTYTSTAHNAHTHTSRRLRRTHTHTSTARNDHGAPLPLLVPPRISLLPHESLSSPTNLSHPSLYPCRLSFSGACTRGDATKRRDRAGGGRGWVGPRVRWSRGRDLCTRSMYAIGDVIGDVIAI
jgi:hypothetical protein